MAAPSRLLFQRCLTASASRYYSTELFHPSSHGTFQLDPPQLYNPFIEDGYLQTIIKQKLPAEVHNEIVKDLERFAGRVSDEITGLGREAELNPPWVRSYDGWGRRVNTLVTGDGWKRLHDVSAEEGLVAIGYERKHAQWSRLYQYIKLFLFSPSSGLYSCPLAMTDGAAKLIESMDVGYLKENALPRLVTRDPMEFWTSGQWMTEKRGGSDVGASTTTYAVRDHDSHAYRLHGYKWFSSATDADMAFTLARIVNEDGQVNQGSAGLSLFYVETRDHNGSMNNIIIEKLKDKLGTRQLPTAELLLDGTIAQLVGDEGRGIPNISPMLTITRLHNVVSSVAAMRRITFLARDYSTKRKSFGKYLADHPLFVRTLASLELETRGCLLLALELAELLGKEEMGVASPQDVHLLRLMMPVAKLYTAKQAVSVVSEGLECFGGQGYIEDTGIPTLFRDSQVLPIWEGTTNILSLDVLRAIKKSHNEAILALGSKVDAILSDDMTTRYGLETETHTIKNWYETLVKFMSEATSEDIVILAARDISFTIAQVYVGVLLLKVSCDQPDYPLHRVAVKRWCQRNIPLMPHNQYERQVTNADVHLIMDGYKLSLSK